MPKLSAVAYYANASVPVARNCGVAVSDATEATGDGASGDGGNFAPTSEVFPGGATSDEDVGTRSNMTDSG
eukprot:scaffold236428_cov29-Prasinocladus_malaysianus.AAC.1